MVDVRKQLLNVRNAEGETVLHVVSKFADVETFRFLENFGSVVTVQDNCGNIPLHTLLTSDSFSKEMFTAVGDFPKEILKIKNNEGKTLLHLVGKTGDNELFQDLLQNGANVAAKDERGNTPLHLLIDVAGRLVKLRDQMGETKGGDEDVMKLENVFKKLLDLGESLDDLLRERNKEDETVLHIACKHGSVVLAQCLMSFGAKPSDIDKSKTPPVEARKYIDLIYNLEDKFVEKLILSDQKDSDPEKNTDSENTKIQTKKTILHKVAAHGMTRLVSKFEDIISLGEQDNKKITPLHTAAKERHYETLKKMIESSERKCQGSFSREILENLLKIQNDEGDTALHIVMKDANVEIVEYLIKKGSKLGAVDNKGNTPLHQLILSAEIEPYCLTHS